MTDDATTLATIARDILMERIERLIGQELTHTSAFRSAVESLAYYNDRIRNDSAATVE